MNFWHAAATAVRERFRSSALAQYGAGLHTDCDDCATPPSEVTVPAPRARSGAETAARSLERS